MSRVQSSSRRWLGQSGRCGGTGDGGESLIDEIVHDGARRILAAALEAEVAANIESFATHVDKDGQWLVVRNGYRQERAVRTAAGAAAVKARRSTTSGLTRKPLSGSGSPR